MSLLERILEQKRVEIAAAREASDEPPTQRRSTLDVARLLRRSAAPGGRRPSLRLITEIKFKSPSAGELSRVLDAASRAWAYAEAGAAMVSVLCDEAFFGGGFGDLSAARARVDTLARDVPLLAKEFVLDEAQLDQARSSGADAVLLIARIVGPARLRELHEAARARNLAPLVEVVTDDELATALECGAKIIGVNARDLDTLAMDPARAARLLAAIPEDRVAVHLSGIKSEEDVRAIAAGRADAALLGEALMREADPQPLVRRLVLAASGG